MNARIKRYLRGIKTIFKSCFIERPKGLDFSLRQKNTNIKKEGNHGYALTEEKPFKHIMNQIDANHQDSFIDIGCGKGGVLLYAKLMGLHRVAGIEVEDSLFHIATNNFKKLRIDDIELYHQDATLFNGYSDYNIFFMFNPFDRDIYIKVVDCVTKQTKEQLNGRPVYMICYGASIKDYILNTGCWDIYMEYTDEVRVTGVCIWRRNGKV